MRFIHGIIPVLLLVSLCSALPIDDEHVHQKIARVQSFRAVQIGPMDHSATGSAEHAVVPHGRAGTGTILTGGSSSASANLDVNSGVHQNLPPSIPIVHPAVDLSNGTAAVAGAASINGTTALDSSTAVDSLLDATACDAGGECTRLGESVVSAGEGPECRALLVTGKCSSKCLTALKEAAEHKLWDACAKRCDTDLVTGAASRLVELCQVRQPTLLDASKEALQIVAAAPGAGKVIQAFFVISVLLGGLMICYKRKSTLRMFFQKRLKRRSSERSIV